jgi:hypothetical protein
MENIKLNFHKVNFSTLKFLFQSIDKQFEVYTNTVYIDISTQHDTAQPLVIPHYCFNFHGTG